jgi:hypothetical protein
MTQGKENSLGSYLLTVSWFFHTSDSKVKAKKRLMIELKKNPDNYRKMFIRDFAFCSCYLTKCKTEIIEIFHWQFQLMIVCRYH